jgi:hypothetical protein
VEHKQPLLQQYNYQQQQQEVGACQHLKSLQLLLLLLLQLPSVLRELHKNTALVMTHQSLRQQQQ